MLIRFPLNVLLATMYCSIEVMAWQNCDPSQLNHPKVPKYRLTEIGALSGGIVDRVVVRSINDKGEVVGGTVFDNYRGQGGTTLPMVWRNGVLEELPNSGGGFAASINNRGEIAGSNSGLTGSDIPVIWKAGRVSGIAPDVESAYGNAAAVNDLGQVVGFYTFQADGSGGINPFLYDKGLLQRLAVPHPSIWGGVASSISNSGLIVGEVFMSDGNRRAVIWEKELSRMLPLPPGGFDNSVAIDVNARGQAVGGAFKAGTNLSKAIIWGPTGSMHFLDPPENWSQLFPIAINDSGVVVGQLGVNDGNSASTSGFVFVGDKVHDLQCLITNSSGWDIGVVMDINAKGQIVGDGTFLGRRTGFLLEEIAK